MTIDLTHIVLGYFVGGDLRFVGKEFCHNSFIFNIATNVLTIIVVFRFFYLNVGDMFIYLVLFSYLHLFSASIFVTCRTFVCAGLTWGG